MGPTANDIDQLDAMDEVDEDADTDTFDAVVIVSSIPEDMGTAQARIDQTRAEMGDTMGAIKDRLNPQQLMQQARDTVSQATVGKAQDAASAVVETARDTGMATIEFLKDNAIPMALTGAGIAWLVMSARRQNQDQQPYIASRPNYRYGPGYPGSDELQSGSSGGSSAASQALGRVSDVAGQVQDKAGQIVDQVQDKAGQIAGQVQVQASQLGAQARYQSRHAMDWFQQLMQGNPLAVGAAAIAIGAAIGLLVPETDQESRWMGTVRDNFMQKAQQTAHDVLEDKAHQVADAVADKVHDMAQEAADTIG